MVFVESAAEIPPGISDAYAAAIAKPNLIADESKLGITIAADPDAGTLSISDNGIGMSRDEMITQGTADLGLIPLVDGGAPAATETSPTVGKLIDSLKQILGAEVADVRVSDRLTDSAVCLVAPDSGPDRQFEKLLSAAGRLDCAAKPILETNPLHGLVTRLAALEDVALRDDIAHLLLDEARVLDGERPADAQLFAARLGWLMASSLK